MEFVKHEVADGGEICDAVINAGKARMRPILITALTLMAGSYMILDDLIFKGMAVSLLFGAGVATVLTLVVIPLGCISIKKHFYMCHCDDGEVIIYREEPEEPEEYKLPLWMRIYSSVINAAMWLFYIGRMVVIMAKMGLERVFGASKNESEATNFASEPAVDSPPTPSEPEIKTPASESSGDKPKEDKSSADKTASTIKPSAETVAKKTVKKKSSPKKKTLAKKKTPPKKKAVVKKRRGIKLKDDPENIDSNKDDSEDKS